MSVEMYLVSVEMYLGDGVYASHDGYQIWLKTKRMDGVNEIALEPKVFRALLDYACNIGLLGKPVEH